MSGIDLSIWLKKGRTQAKRYIFDIEPHIKIQCHSYETGLKPFFSNEVWRTINFSNVRQKKKKKKKVREMEHLNQSRLEYLELINQPNSETASLKNKQKNDKPSKIIQKYFFLRHEKLVHLTLKIYTFCALIYVDLSN